jgi:2'-hydroxyisoflavone reductase
MKILVLGGTKFLGRYIVETLLAAGHRVSILNRGLTPDPLAAEVERLRGDRDSGAAGLTAVAGRSWDACVDVSGYTPRQVRASAETLRERVGHYVFMSAVSVYADSDRRPIVETHPRLPPAAEDVLEINGETYGPLKVACENLVQLIYAGRCTLLRPQIVTGPHDPSGRYAYWVQRALRDGEMLAPGDGSDHLQVIDVRDLARFARIVLEQALGGSFNLAGPRLTWAAFMTLLGARNIVWVPAKILRDAGLTFNDLPLYRPEHSPCSGLMDISPERAHAAGLTWTATEITMRDMQAWCPGQHLDCGLSPERETALIGLARPRVP